jgi:hypothetical protein
MGPSSHTQTNELIIAPGTPETFLRSGSRLLLSAGPTAQAAPTGNVSALLIDPAATDACTGRAVGCAWNPSTFAPRPAGGVA